MFFGDRKVSRLMDSKDDEWKPPNNYIVDTTVKMIGEYDISDFLRRTTINECLHKRFDICTSVIALENNASN